MNEIQTLIEQARTAVAIAANVGLTQLNWHIGLRINSALLGGERVAYGEEIVSTLSRQLTARYGKGFSVKTLRHGMRFQTNNYTITSPLWYAG